MTKGQRYFHLGLAAMSLLPVLLFACLGAFSRLMADDYGMFATALKLGGRHHFDYWWGNWIGSYSFILLTDLLAPLGAARIPAILPAFICLLWLVGATWLAWLVLRSLPHKRGRLLPLALILAGFAVSGSFNALYTRESLYYFAAAARYALPLGILALHIACSWELARRRFSWPLNTLFALASALMSFLNCGLSELHAVVQSAILSLLLVGFGALAQGRLRRQSVLFIAAAWLGAGLSLVVQLTSPGLAGRLAASLTDSHWITPIYALPALLEATVAVSLERLLHQESILSFLLALSIGLATTLLLAAEYPAPRSPASPPAEALLRRAGIAAILSLLGVMCFMGLAVALGLRSIGIVFDRMLAHIPLLYTLSGLICGFYLGMKTADGDFGARAVSRRVKWARLLGFALACVISLGVIARQVQLMPYFATYAREWDARHQRIIELAQKGERVIEVAPYSFDLTAFLAESGESYGGDFPYLYGVDSIVVREGEDGSENRARQH